tara:strand:- start:16119 stop:17372 length:1254 start_codon:yes stop_codon:yes gene_type:complete
MINNKILIVSYYWPPSGGSGVQRWLNFSNQLSQKGWDVTVFTALNAKYPIIDNELNKTLDPHIKVIKIPIFEPTSFLQSNNPDNLNSNTILNKTLKWIRANLFFPDSRMFWIKTVSKQAIDYINKNNINCLITTAPPFSTHLIGLNIKKATNVKWISDFRDPWSDFFQFKLLPLLPFQKNRHSNAELQCLKFSDTVITTSPSLTKKYSIINENSYTVFNGFDSYVKTKDFDKFLLMYSGVMKSIQNPKNLWTVLEEIALENKNFLKDLKVRLIGDFDNEIKNELNGKSIESKVEFEKYLEKEKLDKEISMARILILSSVNLDSVNNIIPGKLYYYFSFKRPILAFSNNHSDVSELIKETNTGRVFDFSNKIDLKNHILELYNNYKFGINDYAPKGIDNYTFDILSNQIIKILKKTIN